MRRSLLVPVVALASAAAMGGCIAIVGDFPLHNLGQPDAEVVAPDAAADASSQVDADAAVDAGIDAPFGCESGLTDCDGGCVNETNDPANCGGCGVVCPGNASCQPSGSTGQCVCTGSNMHLCSGVCVSNVDVGSCGAANCTPCPTPAHSTATCNGPTMTCGYTCVAKWADCNGMASDGCETDLTAASNCGTCGNNCANATQGAACIGTVCGCLSPTDCTNSPSGHACLGSTIGAMPFGCGCQSVTDCPSPTETCSAYSCH